MQRVLLFLGISIISHFHASISYVIGYKQKINETYLGGHSYAPEDSIATQQDTV